VVEYGGGINNGPAGQVGGGGGVIGPGSPAGQGPDVFGSITHGLGDLANQVLSLPPGMLALGIVLVFVGLIVLKRAF
jgi:hypothetical protein